MRYIKIFIIALRDIIVDVYDKRRRQVSLKMYLYVRLKKNDKTAKKCPLRFCVVLWKYP